MMERNGLDIKCLAQHYANIHSTSMYGATPGLQSILGSEDLPLNKTQPLASWNLLLGRRGNRKKITKTSGGDRCSVENKTGKGD